MMPFTEETHLAMRAAWSGQTFRVTITALRSRSTSLHRQHAPSFSARKGPKSPTGAGRFQYAAGVGCIALSSRRKHAAMKALHRLSEQCDRCCKRPKASKRKGGSVAVIHRRSHIQNLKQVSNKQNSCSVIYGLLVNTP